MVYGSDKDKPIPSGVAGEPIVSLIRAVGGIASSPASARTPLFVQAAAGVVFTGVGYYSLFKSDKDPNNLPVSAGNITVPPVQDQEDVVRAIDKEAQNSSNKFWGVKKS